MAGEISLYGATTYLRFVNCSPTRLGTRGKIKLIYIDPPFATRQDFMKDKEKAYRDKVVGAQFIEFLRRRLILLRELLADDGSIYVHLDWKKGHYLKAAMDEVFGEENFVTEIVGAGQPLTLRRSDLPLYTIRSFSTAGREDFCSGSRKVVTHGIILPSNISIRNQMGDDTV